MQLERLSLQICRNLTKTHRFKETILLCVFLDVKFGSRDGQRLNCSGKAWPLTAIVCGDLRAPMPRHFHITLTTLLHSPAVKIDRKDHPRYAQALTYTLIQDVRYRHLQVLICGICGDNLTYIGKRNETKRYETTNSTFN